MGLGLNPCHSASLLCALEKMTCLLWPSLPSVTEDGKHDLPPRAAVEINERTMKCILVRTH